MKYVGADNNGYPGYGQHADGAEFSDASITGTRFRKRKIGDYLRPVLGISLASAVGAAAIVGAALLGDRSPSTTVVPDRATVPATQHCEFTMPEHLKGVDVHKLGWGLGLAVQVDPADPNKFLAELRADNPPDGINWADIHPGSTRFEAGQVGGPVCRALTRVYPDSVTVG